LSRIVEWKDLSELASLSRRNKEYAESFNKALPQLQFQEFHIKAEKLSGSEDIYYLRAKPAHGKTHEFPESLKVFFQYSKTQENSVEVLGESTIKTQKRLIQILLELEKKKNKPG